MWILVCVKNLRNQIVFMQFLDMSAGKLGVYLLLFSEKRNPKRLNFPVYFVENTAVVLR